MDRSKFLDDKGNTLTQSLFLEIGYNTDFALYTLKDYDHEYQGKVYPSIYKLYMQEDDPTEFLFAEKYFMNYAHWKRISENRLVYKHVCRWREELEIKFRAMAVRALRDMAQSENGNFQAAKYLAEKGWDKNKVGRPSKQEMERRAAISEAVDREYAGDVKRLEDYRK